MGNPYAGLDEAGAGNVAMGAGLRPTTKGVDEPPDPKARAPVLDPTGRRTEASPWRGASSDPTVGGVTTTRGSQGNLTTGRRAERIGS